MWFLSRSARSRRLVVTVVMLCAAATAALAQRFDFAYDPRVSNVPYNGRFVLARLKYDVGPGGYYYYGMPAWAHGYPRAEKNLAQILDAVTIIHPQADAANVFAVDDPELCKFPVAYMTEAGYWELSDREARALRAYMIKGGFIIFDDFRPPPRGGRGWENFEANMRRILPGVQIVDLQPWHPIFHDFFDIDSFDIIPQDYDQGRPIIRGIFENNDQSRRLMAVINFNTDVSNFWEFSGDGLKPVGETNEAYELGVNYIIYGLTH